MKINFRLFIFIVAFLFSFFLSIPSIFNLDSGKKISLGLDLQGGLHLMLGVETEKAVESKIKSLASSVKYFTEDKDILIDELKIDNLSVSFSVLDADEELKIDEYLNETQGLDIKKSNSKYSITYTEQEILNIKNFAINQAIDTIRNRLDQFGLAEPSVTKQGDEKVLVELPGIKNEEDEKRARELISKPANLQLMAIDEAKIDQVNSLSEYQAQALGDIILKDANNEEMKYLLKELPILDGEMLTDAKVGFDQNNQPVINFTLNSKGAKIFGDFTTKNIGKRLAVVLDKKVYSAPVIRERIGGGSGQISGGFTMQEAQSVAIALRSGALLAPVKMLEKRSVGPSLGADSIQASLFALISGFLAVIAFMVYYYKRAGIIANIALVVNLFLIISIMALFGATLTLPGMAGIVLTVGMAVDANVIITERIRELLGEKISIKKAIELGYQNASRAILDANITTLIAAVLLYAYGTGPIKGFAITISIGILASMLTAILGTYGIYLAIESKIKKEDSKYWFGV